jgi:hypothetical protein
VSRRIAFRLGDAGAAIRAGAQRGADFGDRRQAAAGDQAVEGVEANAEAGADGAAGIGERRRAGGAGAEEVGCAGPCSDGTGLATTANAPLISLSADSAVRQCNALIVRLSATSARSTN